MVRAQQEWLGEAVRISSIADPYSFFFFFRALFLTLKGKIVANLAEIQPKVEGIFIEPNITPWL